ncbi:sensor histidine kinase [Dactylosporangium roseum]|uniref:Sensor histidine kinase n=1 Tax=Dactylosporangium roseum TaxID=47989 RepID=A0ABY5YZT0_9ACTN|nr:sensor histidine kinase [Dactylosporangium roseum]UWZ35042.1 sensor histidine kinase [Dactylosporangium roseum]
MTTRTGAAAGHHGYFHEAIFYDRPDDLLAVVVPFLLDGVAAGEPSIVAFGEHNAALVRDALPEGHGVTFLTGEGVYARPAAAIRSYRRLLAGHVADGAAQIRIVGELAPDLLGRMWDWWARYEAAINHAYDDFPLWSMCAYDTRRTLTPVLDDVARTHPNVAMPGGRHVPSGSFVDPLTFLSEPSTTAPDPIEERPPVAELADPTPGEARDVVRAVDGGRLRLHELEELTIAVSEVVTNALRHGRPPVRMRVWTAEDRIVVAVSDGGAGPKDPFAGLMPADHGGLGGLGLWITYQSCNHVRTSRTADGFTITLTGGAPPVG